MSERPKISVLVPICNVEKYLEQCVNSITAQTLRDIEIICIDDGSTDGSPTILKKLADADNRIKVITKKNSGYGDSMNRGIAEARGDFIGIVESDDYIDPNMFESLYKIAKKNDAQVVKSDYYLHYDKLDNTSMQWREDMGGIWKADWHSIITKHDNKANTIPKEHVGVIEQPRRWDSFADNLACDEWIFFTPPAIWSAIYRRDFLIDNDIKFLPSPGASYQDTSFAFKVWATADRVCYTNKAYLHYRQDNEKSSVNSSAKTFCVVDEYAEIEKYLKEHDLFNLLAKTFNHAKVDTYMWNASRLNNRDEMIKFLKVAQKELRQAANDHHINWFCYDKNRLTAINEMLNNPEMYVDRIIAQRNAKISIVVPVYNTEDYIEDCIKSLIGQTLKDIEILMVDDGSSDRSVEIIERYCQNDPRIRLIYKANGGQSSARNLGVWLSTAPFVQFCDSDDTFHPDMCQKMYGIITKNNTDIAACGLEMNYLDAFNKKRDDTLYYMIKFDGKVDIDEHIIRNTDDSVCNKIFRRSNINKFNMFFPEGFRYEDYYYVTASLLTCKTIYFIDDKLYTYNRRPGSTMTTTFADASFAIDHVRIYRELFKNYAVHQNLLSKYCNFFAHELVSMYTAALRYTSPANIQDLYNVTNNFISEYSGYIKQMDQANLADIYKTLPQRTMMRRIKQSIKRFFYKTSLNYRRQDQTIERLDMIIKDINTLKVKNRELEKSINRLRNK